MKPNVLRQKLESGEPTVSTHIHSTWPSVVEAVGHTGIYDYVEFVAEYGPSDQCCYGSARQRKTSNRNIQNEVDRRRLKRILVLVVHNPILLRLEIFKVQVLAEIKNKVAGDQADNNSQSENFFHDCKFASYG